MRSTGVLMVLLLAMAATISNCGWPRAVGDLAQEIRYENRLPAEVTVSYRYDDEDKYMRGVTIPPNSHRTESLMLRSAGFTVKATSSAGTVVLERHYLWKDVPDAPLDIVIGP